MKIFYCDEFVLPLPPSHRFPMTKYSRLREQLAATGQFAADGFQVPPPVSDEDLLLAHSSDYLDRVKRGALSESEVRALGFPWSEALVRRSRHSVGGTISAGLSALRSGTSANLAGGTHHAFRDRGEGYCVFNDVVVASRVLQRDHLVDRTLILDVDVHQGNGTAALVAEDSTIFAFSIHSQKNYPVRKETSDLDVEVPDGCQDETYLDLLRPAVEQAVDRSRADLVFYIAGADPFVGDRFGRLGLTKAGLAERDRICFDLCRQAGLPVALVMGGGYAPNIQDIVDIHAESVLAAERQLLRPMP
jgi:acetoin utilization deacetylase AcuC-like enzyme